MMTWSEVVLRLGAATLMGAAIGINRGRSGKPAGLRTQALVTLGSATVMVAMFELATVGSEFDTGAISRVVQGVLTGIGFLGGGVILRDSAHHRVEGLTTAASIWVSAALGLACGAGLWRLALLALVLSLLVLKVGLAVEGTLQLEERSAAGKSAGSAP
ncbi:MAG: MgtC/SapB family protein [Verrucomicrobiae bacterium]|nr:MgtC/SapB family protein [Verrucomicrobiae bacterium]